MIGNPLLSSMLSTIAGLMLMLLPAAAQATSLPTEFERGVIAYQTGHYRQALEAFSQTLKQDAEHSAAYSNRCLTYMQLEVYPQAIVDCSHALRLNPDSHEPYLNRGLAFYRLEALEPALDDLDRAVQQQPDDYRAYYNRGLVQAASGHPYRAIADYTLSIHYTPTLPKKGMAAIYDDRAEAYLAVEDMDAAIADLTQALDFDSTDARAYFNRASAHFRRGDLMDSRNDYDHALILNPHHPPTHFNRGLVNQQLGYFRDAMVDFQQAAAYFHDQGQEAASRQALEKLTRLQSARTVIA